jgi:AcrR family transcriptional regulator
MTKKQSDIFEAAKKLFYKFGVRRVTIEDICEEANASKMTFYNYFSNAIEKYREMVQSEITAEEKIRKTFELKLESAMGLEMDFLADLYKYPDDALKEHLNVWKQRSIDLTKSWFIEMQQNGLIIKELNFPVFMLYADAIQSFVLNDETMNFFGTTRELTHTVSKLFLYGITGGSGKENPTE